MSLLIEEVYVNADEGCRYGESGKYRAFTDDLDVLYRAMVREFGRCVSKVYIDGPGGKPVHVGWVFEKRVPYVDSAETYLRRVWVTIHTRPDTLERTIHYLDLSRKKEVAV